MPPILEIVNLEKKVGGPSASPLFSGISATIAEPTIVHVIGTSGQGKSTLLRILGLLAAPDKGEIILHGTPSTRCIPEQWRRTVSYVSQQPVMLPGSVEENLRTVSRLQQTVFDQTTAESYMNRVGLGELDWQKEASQLSGGEKQRLALVRTLLLRPAILLLDEITASLDVNSQHAVEELLREIHHTQETSMIWVTHQLEQARSIGKRIWFMAEQTLLEDRPTAMFFNDPQTEAARRFLQAVAVP